MFIVVVLNGRDVLVGEVEVFLHVAGAGGHFCE